MSALEGDNVVKSSKRMPWFHGVALLEHLETIPTSAARFPARCVSPCNT